MATLAFAGDWHGDTFWAKNVLHVLNGMGIKRLYHVGDFGLWPGNDGASFLYKTHRWLEKYDMEIWVTPGNHEDWPRLEQLYAKYQGEIAPVSKKYSRIKFLPRGYRWEDQGVSFVSLGGAPSIDREYRREGKSWWPEEMITTEHVAQTVAGGYADIMITHDSPRPGVRRVEEIVSGKSMWSTAVKAYAAVGRELLTQAFDGVKPRLLVHGHYHVLGIKRNDDWGNIISLENEHAMAGGNVALIESEEFLKDYSFEIRIPPIEIDWNL